MDTVTATKTKRRRKGVPYSDAVASRILDRLCDGESLRTICKDADLPGERTVRGWAVDDHQGFGQRYARARMIQALRYADEIVDILSEPIPTDESGRGDTAAVQDKRLRVDTLKWLVGKLHPRVFGDKLAIGGDASMPPIRLSDVQIVHQVQALLSVAAERRAEALGNGSGSHQLTDGDAQDAEFNIEDGDR